ncbi:MAG: amidohydrolase, partial [Bacteroidetes bacterium]|nr:amidohydrolase [Bacteroidota bacterium]
MKIVKSILILSLLMLLTSCSKSPVILYTNGKIYTMDGKNTVVDAMAVRDGKILETGKSEDI